MDKISKIAEKIASHYFQIKEKALSPQPKQSFRLNLMQEGISISIKLIKKLSDELLKVNKKNKSLYEKFQYINTLTPPIGAAVSLGTSYILKNNTFALTTAPFLIGAGPVLSVILHLRNEKQLKNMVEKIDGYIIEILVSFAINKKLKFTAEEISQILEVWNFLKRPAFNSLMKRVEIYNKLTTENPALTILLLSSFVLLEKSGMSEKNKILELGIEKIITLSSKTKNRFFKLFTITTLNIFKQSSISRNIVQKAIISSDLNPEDKRSIVLNSKGFIKQLKNSKLTEKTKNLILEWYKTVLFFQSKLQTESF